jgi:hypothetical protein
MIGGVCGRRVMIHDSSVSKVHHWRNFGNIFNFVFDIHFLIFLRQISKLLVS